MAAPLGLVIVGGQGREREALLWYLRPKLAAGPIAGLEADAVLVEPQGDGTDPLPALRALAATSAPVVVWTSSPVPGEADAFREAGVAAVLRKDEDLADLLVVLARVAGDW